MGILETEKEIAAVERANFILLSLYREYAIKSQHNEQLKEEYFGKMRQIKHDLRYLTHKELLVKTERIYRPALLKMKG